MYIGIDFKIKWGPKSPTEIIYSLRNYSTWKSVLEPDPKELEFSLQFLNKKLFMCEFPFYFVNKKPNS